MAEDDASNNLFAFDDANQFFDDRSASADINTDNSYTSDDAQFDSSAWEFPDMPFTFGAPSSASGGMDPSYPASVWDSPPFDMQQSPSLGFDDASSSNNDAMFLFGPPAVPAQQQQQNNNSNNNQQQQQKQQQQQQQQRQPTPVKAERGGMPVTILTPAAEEKLRNIAMPPHLQYHSPKSASSPESPVSKSGAKSNKPNQKKRKVSEDLDDDVSEDEDGKPVKKTSHNMIEKRYRNNLNDKISALRDAVPSLRIMSKSARGEDTTEDRQELHGLTPAHKLNKATVGSSHILSTLGSFL